MSAVNACWRTIGVLGGDHSCDRLAEVIHCRNCPIFVGAARSLFAQPAELEPSVPDLALTPETRLSVLLFRVGEQWLALPSRDLAEVAPGRRVSRLPHRAGGKLEGVVNVRGEVHLCVALDAVLGTPTAAGSDSERLVLMRSGDDGLLAFRVSQVLGLRAFAQEAIGALPDSLPEVLQRCSRGVLTEPDRAALLLDGASLVSVLEEALFT